MALPAGDAAMRRAEGTALPGAIGSGIGIGAEDGTLPLLDAIDLPIIVLGPDCRIARFNHAASFPFGLSPSDVGRSYRDVRRLMELNGLEALCSQAVADVTPCRREIQAGDRWFLVRVAPFMSAEGDIDGVVLTLTNVTAFHASIDQALVDREYTKAILNTVRDPLVVISADLRVQTANRAFHATFGITREDTQSVPLDRLGNDDWQRLGVWTALKGIPAQQREALTAQVAREVPGSGRRTYLLDACRLSLPGPAMILLNFHDITDLKLAEDLLDAKVAERTAELHEANYQLASFSYSASHDLRAPLRAIRGYLDAMLDLLGKVEDPEVHHYGRQIADATERMDRLIEDLLDYSRLAKVEIPRGPTRLVDVISDGLQRIEADLSAARAEVIVSVAPELPRVVAHRPTLVQAIANLASNAVKFVAPGVTPIVRLRAEPVDGRIRLWVEDNGIGIAREHHERIFRVFEQLHARSQYPGTGAGLAIVKRAVERMGGTVGVESEPGHGSRFWIELPRA